MPRLFDGKRGNLKTKIVFDSQTENGNVKPWTVSTRVEYGPILVRYVRPFRFSPAYRPISESRKSIVSRSVYSPTVYAASDVDIFR